MKKPSILIAITHQGDTVAGLEAMLAEWLYKSGYDGELYFSCRKPTYSNRNYVCIDFLKKKRHTHLLFIDSDTVPFENPLNMVKHDVDVVGGVYPMWQKDHFEWLAMDIMPNGGYKTTSIRKGLVEVDGLGAGCLLMKRKVIESMKAPFADLINEDGTRSLGHDYNFCRKAKKNGFKVYADWDVLCDHHKVVPLVLVAQALKKSFDEGVKEGKKQKLTDDVL